MAEEVEYGWFYAVTMMFVAVVLLDVALIGYSMSDYDVRPSPAAAVQQDFASR